MHSSVYFYSHILYEQEAGVETGGYCVCMTNTCLDKSDISIVAIGVTASTANSSNWIFKTLYCFFPMFSPNIISQLHHICGLFSFYFWNVILKIQATPKTVLFKNCFFWKISNSTYIDCRGILFDLVPFTSQGELWKRALVWAASEAAGEALFWLKRDLDCNCIYKLSKLPELAKECARRHDRICGWCKWISIMNLIECF